MTTDSALQRLLEQVQKGDSEAASAAYEEYVPYLRMVVRRQMTTEMQAKFDSTDVVQSVWADLLDGFRKGRWSFESPDHLRAFLVRATRNRLVDYVRRNGKATQREVSFELNQVVGQTGRPSAEARANEQWRDLLTRCSEEQRPILELKCRGYSLAEIAEQTGYHPSSIRRILYDLADETGT